MAPDELSDTTDDEAASSRLAVRIATVLRHAERRSPRVERALLATAVVLFVGGVWIAWKNLPDVETSPRWWLLIPAGLLAVAALVINAEEFRIAAGLLGRRVRFQTAFHVSVLSSAANVLPLPGAVMMKTRALRQEGHPYGSSFALTAAVGLMWVALAFVAGSILQLADDRPRPGLVMLAIGLVAIAVTYGLLRSALGRLAAARAAVPVAAIELASVAAASLRIFVVLAALGFDADIGQAVALTVAAIVSSAVGIFPAGLGLRELLSAAMAEIVGLDPAVGLLVAAVDRILGYAVLGLVAGTLAVTGQLDDARSPGTAVDRSESNEDPS